jgi:hypothetical protein
MNGERAPGGNENWRDWDTKTEAYLRALEGAQSGPTLSFHKVSFTAQEVLDLLEDHSSLGAFELAFVVAAEQLSRTHSRGGDARISAISHVRVCGPVLKDRCGAVSAVKENS